MICSLCLAEIKPEEYVLIGSICLYNGPEDTDFIYSDDYCETENFIHLSCLNNKSKFSVKIDVDVEHKSTTEHVVRSDALELFNI